MSAGADGEMWCCQIPGFEALVLAELQRQQQCSQFCDTLLKTDGVSVPAHSCILSAISPRISSALSSMPAPPAGQSRLLEFRALGPCTLLHMVRLLYSGEMAGEGGEEEKQEAISAAAKLGIHGLVEVTRRDRKSRQEEGDGRRTEVGVQTEPPVQEENEGRRSRWRREVKDGCSVLWRETLSGGGKDTWTQTEEVQVSTAPPPPHPAASFETIDMTALQSFGQTDPPQIPYVPISLIYPLEENQTQQPATVPVDYMQESTAAGHTSVAPSYSSDPPSLLPFPNQVAQSAADPQSWWAGPKDVAAAEEWEGGQLEQFQGNIPGYINHFLNPEKEEGPGRGQPRRRRQGAGAGGPRRAGRPRGRTRGRGRGGLTQTVDVQDVGVGKLQKLFLQRWGMKVSRTGQGGGAAGRKLHLKTRELLKSPKSCQRRRRRGKEWEFSPSWNSDGGAGSTQRGRRSAAQQSKQVILPVSRPQRARPTASLSFSSPPMRFYNLSLQPSPSPDLLSPAASYVSPASSLLHTTPVAPPAPPPHEEQPEHFDRLLEEVMMGLNILPNHNNRPEPPHAASSSSCTFTSSGNTLTQNKQQGRTTGFLEAGLHGPTQVVAVARGAGSSSFTNSDAPILQQHGEGELNEMLEHFLQSFEQHVGSCTAREEVEVGGQSSTEAPIRSSQISEQQQNQKAKRPARLSQPRSASTVGKDGAPTRQRRRRRVNQYLFSHEKKRVRVRKPASSSSAETKTAHDRRDKQLQQMPVVKLERSGLLPARVTLQGHSCQSLEVKSLVQTKTSSSSVKHAPNSSSGKNQTHASLLSWGRKMYPIRSRFKKANLDSIPFLEEPLPAGQLVRRRGRPKKNGLFTLSNGEISTSPTQPQQPVDDQVEKDQEKHEEELSIQQQEETGEPTMRGRKRGAESEEETSDGATVDKRVCFEQMPHSTSETCTLSSEAAAIEIDDVIDVETVSLSSVGDCLQRPEQEEKPVWTEIKLRGTEEDSTDKEMESSGDEIINVDGDMQDDAERELHPSRTGPSLSHFVEVKPTVSPPSHSELSLGSTGSWEEDEDEDIDVIGGSGPTPDPVIISWTESSEDEKEEGDEDVEVVETQTDCTSSTFVTAMSKGELVNRKYQTGVLLR